jgi:hypothetical protein
MPADAVPATTIGTAFAYGAAANRIGPQPRDSTPEGEGVVALRALTPVEGNET